jgi:hypothetical protein
LIEKRKTMNIPHISYDLDGDGFVGGRDYVIAKQFDKDQDGGLNTTEKKNALDAIKTVSILYLESILEYRVMSKTLCGTLKFQEGPDLIDSFKKEEYL